MSNVRCQILLFLSTTKTLTFRIYFYLLFFENNFFMRIQPIYKTYNSLVDGLVTDPCTNAEKDTQTQADSLVEIGETRSLVQNCYTPKLVNALSKFMFWRRSLFSPVEFTNFLQNPLISKQSKTLERFIKNLYFLSRCVIRNAYTQVRAFFSPNKMANTTFL